MQVRSLRNNSRRLVYANISSLTRGDAFEYFLPKVKKLKSATMLNGVVPPGDGTDPFALNSIPPESQLKEWKTQMGKTLTCYAETPSGNFDLSSIQNMIKIHEIKNVKAAVEQEIVWFSQDYTKPQTVAEHPPDTVIMNFQKMLYTYKYDEAIPPHGITPTELSMICGNRWLSDDHMTWIMKELTDSGTDTYCVYLNGVLNADPMKFRRFRCRDNLPSKVLFSISVGRSPTGETYFGSDRTPGCHWTMCHVDTFQKKITNGDSLAWYYPNSLIEKANMYIKAISPSDDVANYTIVTCHDPSATSSGGHCCGETCAILYPLQTCGSICGVVVMVMAAIACQNPAYFSHLLAKHNQGIPSVFLQTPSRFNKYLRLVIASWITENSVKTSYVIPVQDEFPTNAGGDKQEEPYSNSKTCTISEDTAQKRHTDTNGKPHPFPAYKSPKPKTESEFQQNTEGIDKHCNASTNDNSISSTQSFKPKKQSKFQLQSTEKKKKFQCRLCTSCFTTNFSFRRHMLSQHPTATGDLEGRSECNSCGFKCHRISDLRTHLSKKHNVIFKTESITLNNIDGKSMIIISFICTFSSF